MNLTALTLVKNLRQNVGNFAGLILLHSSNNTFRRQKYDLFYSKFSVELKEVSRGSSKQLKVAQNLQKLNSATTTHIYVIHGVNVKGRLANL